MLDQDTHTRAKDNPLEDRNPRTPADTQNSQTAVPTKTTRLVLLIDDDPADRALCAEALRDVPGIEYQFKMASDEASGLLTLESCTPDIVLLDHFLPGSNGLEILVKLKARRPSLPVILLTGSASESVAANGIKLGASNYLNKNKLLDPAWEDSLGLHHAISLALSEAEPRQLAFNNDSRSEVVALIIDDNPDDREACMRALQRVPEARYRFIETNDGLSGQKAIDVAKPDLVLLDYSLPGSNGLEVLAKIRKKCPFLPVIILTGQGDEGVAVRGIKGGAVDYIVKSNLCGEGLHQSISTAIEQHRTARTITEQNRTIQRQRERLEESNHFLHSLLDYIPDPIFVKDSLHGWLMFNWAFCELMGPPQASVSKGGRPILPPDALSALWAQDMQALASGNTKVTEQRLTDSSGATRLFSIKRATFKDSTGNRVLVGVMRDVTAVRQAEDDFKQQAAQLMSQAQDLAALGSILEESLQEILIVDAATLKIVQVNKGARRNLGYSSSELQLVSVLEVLPEYTEQRLRKLLKPLETGDQVEIVHHTVCRRQDGSLYNVEIHTQQTITRGRTVFVHVVIDETERKKMEQMKSEFISTVSHELRTPLTSIRGALGLVCAGTLGKLPDRAETMVEIAHSNAERLSNLVNDILALEKSVSGKLSVDIRETSVHELLRHAVESHTSYGEKYKVGFLLEEVPADLIVMADAGRLMQVMANLMSNAAKFSPPGSSVRIRCAPQGSNVRFEVADQGCGIPEDFRSHVFERFAQADSSIARRHEGTGLGLAITKQLIEAMGGKIDFHSEIGRGTTFFFDLPAPAKASAEDESSEYAIRVLICEDDPDMALIMKLALEQAGFETATAPTIQDARRKLKDRAFAIMSLDIGLPDADGLEFLHELRSEASTKGMPVVVVSGRTASSRQPFYEDPANVDWLLKPLDHRNFVQTIRAGILRGAGLPRVLYIGSDTAAVRDLAQSLDGAARIVTVKDLTDGYREVRSRRFALLVAEPGLEESADKELLNRFKAEAHDMPPLLLLSKADQVFDGESGCLVAAALAARISAILNLTCPLICRK